LLLFLVKDHYWVYPIYIDLPSVSHLGPGPCLRSLTFVTWQWTTMYSQKTTICDKLHWWRLMVSVETSVTNFKTLKFQTKILKILIQWIVLRTLWTTTVRRLT